MRNLELEIKELIINVLNLEDVKPEDIISDQPLFIEGLGLDSIDALEIGIAIKKKYNITIKSDDANIKKYFASINGLVEFIKKNITREE